MPIYSSHEKVVENYVKKNLCKKLRIFLRLTPLLSHVLLT